MSDPKKVFYENQANSIIKKLALRKMEGYYCPDLESARQKVVELIGEGSKSIAYGGSMTIDEHGFKDEILAAGHELVLRENCKSKEEEKALKAAQVNADVFLMSTNAITLDGELVNIDGRGNRVSFLIYGPESVIIVAGMNKVAANLQDAIDRVHNIAGPANTVRLNCDTPCAVNGRCGNCLAHTICCSTVITRSSIVPGRIKVLLVGEELGY